MSDCDICHKHINEDIKYPDNPTINWKVEYWKYDGHMFRFHQDCLIRRKLELILGRPIN